MASTKNSQNPYKLTNMESVKFMQSIYFDTGSNNAQSYEQKMKVINLICFLTQKMQKVDAKKYESCIKVLSTIFNVDLENLDSSEIYTNFSVDNVRSFGLICDNLLWGTIDSIPKPDGFNSAKEIKDYIVKYFTEEWAPF